VVENGVQVDYWIWVESHGVDRGDCCHEGDYQYRYHDGHLYHGGDLEADQDHLGVALSLLREDGDRRFLLISVILVQSPKGLDLWAIEDPDLLAIGNRHL
jgi:hypothetical protein